MCSALGTVLKEELGADVSSTVLLEKFTSVCSMFILPLCLCVCLCVCMFPQKQYIEKARQHMLAMKRKRVSLDIRTWV